MRLYFDASIDLVLLSGISAVRNTRNRTQGKRIANSRSTGGNYPAKRRNLYGRIPSLEDQTQAKGKGKAANSALDNEGPGHNADEAERTNSDTATTA